MHAPIILGIETSCDETAAAIFRGPELIHQITATQLVHTSYGGVVPEYASREHNKLLGPVVNGVLEQAEMNLSMIEGIAVTHGPGLAGSLLVGLSYAKGLALGLQVPLYGINHIEGHIFRRFGKYNNELFTSITGDQIRLAETVLNILSERIQQLITLRMSMRIVIFLEVVHIKNNKGEFMLVSS